MSKKDFIAFYVKNSNVPRTRILERMDAYPCDCEEKNCKGWQMLTPMGAKIAKAIGHIPNSTHAP